MASAPKPYPRRDSHVDRLTKEINSALSSPSILARWNLTGDAPLIVRLKKEPLSDATAEKSVEEIPENSFIESSTPLQTTRLASPAFEASTRGSLNALRNSLASWRARASDSDEVFPFCSSNVIVNNNYVFDESSMPSRVDGSTNERFEPSRESSVSTVASKNVRKIAPRLTPRADPPGVEELRVTNPYAEIFFKTSHSNSSFRNEVSNICGFFGCRPRWMKPFSSPKAFLPFFSLLAFCQSMIVNGLVNVNVSTLERRFNLSSLHLGLVCGAYPFFCTFIGIPLGYYGDKGNKPLFIALSSLALSAGALIFSLAHFLVGPYQYNSFGLEGTICDDRFRREECQIEFEDGDIHDAANLQNYLYLFLLAQALHAVGGSIIYSVGISFLHENVPASQSPVYVGVFFGIAGLGPAAGFLLGGRFLDIFVDVDKLDAMQELRSFGDNQLSPDDPRWCGAWWIGFVLSMIFTLPLALPLAAFPRSLRKKEQTLPPRSIDVSEKESTPIASSQSAVEPPTRPNRRRDFLTVDDSPAIVNINLSALATHVPSSVPLTPLKLPSPQPLDNGALQIVDLTNGGSHDRCQLWPIFQALRVVLKNPAFVCVALSLAADLFLLNGFAAFMPKFLENQFSLTASFAAMLMGGTLVVAMTLGVILGGLSVKFRSLQLNGMLLQNVFVGFCCCWFLGVLWLRCDGDYLVGFSDGAASLDNDCNRGCACPRRYYQPVCDAVEETQYFSACHAGCISEKESLEPGRKTTYENCACLGRNHSTTVVAGFCKQRGCSSVWIGIVGMFLFLFCHSFCTVPSTEIVLIIVAQEFQSVAMATYRSIGFLLGSVIAPLVFGLVIDNSCILWQTWRCDPSFKGSCWVYDNESFARSLFILGLVSKILSVYFQALALIYRLYRKFVTTGVASIGDLICNKE